MKKLTILTVVFFTALALLNDRRDEGLHPQGHRETDESNTDKPEKFLEFHRGIRTRAGASGPEYSFNHKEKALQWLRTNRFSRKGNARTQSNGVLEWKERGPGNVPGRTRALLNIAGDPTNNTWLAGAATGGIWRTTNGGTSWTEKSADFPALPISSFAANQGADVIYAGTGEFVSSIFSAIGNGIFKSTDQGETWTQIPSTNDHPDFTIVTRIITDPANANLVLATTVPHNLSNDNTSAIMRSANGGTTWTKVKEVSGFLEQIVASPENFSIQYASQNGVGIWKSTDAGVTWNLFNEGMSPTGRIEIAISPVDPTRLFASAEGTLSGQNADLYVSSDRGETWSLINVVFNGNKFDFFEGQGFYDNTIMCDPFDENKVYFGGVSLFRATLSDDLTAIDNFKIEEAGTENFLFLQAFADNPFDNARLDTGAHHNQIAVEIRFGPSQSQKAHRFTVPNGATSGVPENQYTYKNYVDIPFEVWDVTNNRQLMVSFRDQNQNGSFDLVTSALGETVPATQQSREYLYINNLGYNATTPDAGIAKTGGHVSSLMYNIFPALTDGATWEEDDLPDSKLVISSVPLTEFDATTVTIADGRGDFDNKNPSDQVNLDAGVHPDHHTMIPIIANTTQKTYRLVVGNDGGVFVSKVSANPGTANGDWQFKGMGLNTSQFYGVDKKPGANEYIGGMQDNGTRMSPPGEEASALSEYKYALSGDGFEVLWHTKDPDKILGTVYNGLIERSVNGGESWQQATTGLNPNADFPFVTKLSHSKDFPDRVFTVSKRGVHVSDNFGGSWRLRSITDNFSLQNASSMFLDVEVSRANPNVVWAGMAMINTGTPLSLHVSMDGGKTFSKTNNYSQASLGTITKLASHPVEENTAYALFSFAGAPKILRTTNLGESWEDISGFNSNESSSNGFPDVAVYCLYVRPDNPNILWAGTEIGIVESADNGQSWALLEEFPNVSVWDMKGQDNQVVIATHGRGIWTATIETTQNTGSAPELVTWGTSPSRALVLRMSSKQLFDSVHIVSGTTILKTIKPFTAGTQDVELPDIAAGSKDISFVSFKNAAPFQSQLYKLKQLDILDVQDNYVTYFTSTSDLLLDGLTPQKFSATSDPRQSLHTDHNYAVSKLYEVIVRTPVRVSSTLPLLYYSDVAIIQPEDDSISVEATKNGIDWIALKPSYDASYEGDTEQQWQSAFDNNQPGTSAMLVGHEINLSDFFEPGDELLFRWRVSSGPEVTSWGWAMAYISIQVAPVSLEVPLLPNATVGLYPNPVKSHSVIEYRLNNPSEVSLTITDAFGRSVWSEHLGYRSGGSHTHTLKGDGLEAGTYLLMLNTAEGRKAARFVKN